MEKYNIMKNKQLRKLNRNNQNKNSLLTQNIIPRNILINF